VAALLQVTARVRTRGVLVLMFAGGCLQPAERHTDLVGLGPVELDLWIGAQIFTVDVEYHREPDEPCSVLGDDFAGQIGDAPLSTAPGGMVDVCHAADMYNPCTPAPSRCEVPYLGFYELPGAPDAVLTFGDASRTIQCDLGDALVARHVVRVPDGSWEVSRGEAVTVRWSPGGDVARLGIDVTSGAQLGLPTPVSSTNGDLVTFTVPRDLGAGAQTLVFTASGDVTTTKGCFGVTNRRDVHYVVEQRITVR